MSLPSSTTRPSKSSATSARLPAAIRSRRAMLDRVAAVFLVAGQDDLDVGVLERARGLHGAQRGDHHRHAALVVARRPGLRPHCPARPAAGTGCRARTPCRGGRSAAGACPGHCPCGVATMWPARPVARMSIHCTLKPSGSSSARSISPTLVTPVEVERAAVLVDPFLEHGERPRLLGIDGRGSSCVPRGDSGGRAGVAGEGSDSAGGSGLSKCARHRRRSLARPPFATC